VHAQAVDCSDFPNSTLDGFVNPNPPDNITIDQNCTVKNFPADNPLTTNFSFNTLTPGQTDIRWLIIFDNVVHTGQMSCNATLEHKIWFVNGSSSTIQEGCQNLLIPVEKIDKQNPPGTTTASVGVPFTYTLTSPVLFDPATSTVVPIQGSDNDLHGITITDDLNALGIDVTFLGYRAYWAGSGALIAHTFANVGGVLTFDNFPIIPAGEQFVIEIDLVLEDTPVNAPGTQFINIAKWNFGRFIDGTFYEPLPGEWGVSEPLTIAAPNLVVTKTGPATMNLGEWGDFDVDVQNTGLGDAWNVTILDRLPDAPSAGMCDTTAQIQGVQVFQADGVTPVPGKGPLVAGADYTLDITGMPSCEISLTMLTAAGVVGAGERLVISYQTRLDSNSQNGVALTNVVAATEWFNDAVGNPDRVAFSRNLTDGTVGVADHEDAHITTVQLSGSFFEKTVANLTTGVNPAISAAPGDTLRYSLRLQSTDVALSGLTFFDDLGELNNQAVFAPGTLSLVAGTIPAGADVSNTDPFGGTNSGGIIDVRGIDLAAYSEVTLQFDVTLNAGLADGTWVTNQADLISGAKIADSDDPTVNGQADPAIDGDEDPTRLIIEGPPPTALTKAAMQPTATIGETFSYQVTVPSAPHTSPLYDVRILDDLAASAADLEFVSVSRVSGSGAWTPANTGTPTGLVIEDPVNGIDIPAGEQAVIEITVRLADTDTNVAGLSFTNTAAYTYSLIDGDPLGERSGEPGTSAPMTIVEAELTLEKDGPVTMRVTVPGTFTINVHNTGDAAAYGVTITDVLPNQAEGGTCDAAPSSITAQLFEADGSTPVGSPLVPGTDYAASFSGDPACTLTLTALTAAAAIGPDQRLIVTYDTLLDMDTQQDALLTNVAGATEWFSLDTSDVALAPFARTYTRAVTDGTVGVLDHEDAHTIIEFTPILIFEKTVVNATTGEDPGTIATPGDTLRYSLRIENGSTSPVNAFSVVDELDSLNPTAAFEPGSLTVVTLPAGADNSNTDPTGGAAGTGQLEVGNLTLGGLGESVLIEFEVTLAGVLANGSYVYNQSEIIYYGNRIALSDDPYVNDVADPEVDGDEDPTEIQISSAPQFLVQKTSAYVDGDPSVLLAGETLRYSITVQNIGTDHAAGVSLVDLVPANTSYVAGSTTLNGVVVADPGNGMSPLIDGIAINAPQDATAGQLNAGVADNVATVVFDVIVAPTVPDGTVISNQAFVSASDQGIADVPSDDPDTPIADDPTQDVVGNFPLLFAPKSAALQTDLSSDGIINPGDVLRYTITVYNNGTTPATAVELVDALPADTSYVPDTVTLNGQPVGQPDGGVFPLAAGIAVSSADLTPPLPGAGEGTLSPGESAVVQFDLQVNAGVPPGTLITNQASVSTAELPNVLTDGDGNPATGPEPTVVVVGDVQQLSILKDVSVVGGGAALAGATLDYVVTVRNVGSVPAFFVALTDDLDMPISGHLGYVDQSATLNGLAAGISVTGAIITADYFAEYGALPAGETAVLRFRAIIDAGLAEGTTITNTASVSWDDPARSAEASVSIDVGGIPGAGSLSGSVWHDANHDDSRDGTEQALSGWTVELLQNGQAIRSMQSDTDGTYLFTNVSPSVLVGGTYSLRFSAPGAGAATAMLGDAASAFTDGMQRIDDIDVRDGGILLDLNMPVDPNGVVYDSVSRMPVRGATVALVDFRNGQPLPGACFDDPNQQNQVTLASGYYKFDINFSDPACPSGMNYLIEITPPNTNFVSGRSEMIPPMSSETTLPLDVPGCPGSFNDAVLTTAQHCEAQPSEFAPPASVAARSAATNYHVFLQLDDSQQPGSAQVFNNHIPLDPRLDGAVAVTKTTPMLNVSRGQLVPYTITVSNSYGVALQDVMIVDRFPAGFRYVEGSARFDGVPTEPTIAGRELTWSNLALTTDGRHEIKLLLAAGAGLTEGEFVNRAQAMNSFTGAVMSEEAMATVRLVPDPTFDCTDVTGKVFDDANRNGFQDGDEGGLAGVRLVTARGLAAKTDANGRYHITCALTPDESRGSNFVLKLDDRTLPSGFRPSTRPIQVQRATRGKALRVNFGASIHRVVGLDIADPIFEPGSVEMRSQWVPRLALLIEELREGPATLRLSYVADVEAESLVERRLEAMKTRIMTEWETLNCCYELVVEPEVFWRLGGPPDRPKGARK
jgi:uncharacterized repeat protein (TIGR01451 family)